MSGSESAKSSSRRNWLIGALVTGAVCVVGFVATGSRQIPIESIRPAQVPADGYVGSDSCETCHADQYASWHTSYHRTMTQVATPDAIGVDLDDLTVQSEGVTYHFEQDGDIIQVDMPDITSLVPDERMQRRLVLVTGSHHMHVFWYETDESRTLSMLPIVYRLDEQKWIPRDSAFLRPSRTTDVEHGRWNTACIRCHTTHPRERCNPEVKQCDSHVLQLGISCEACHGPGGSHVAARSDSGTPIADIDAIVNPGKLTHQRSSEVCAQCHSFWEVTDRDLPLVWESGFTFRPGDELEATARRRIVTCCGEPEDPEVRDMMKYFPGYEEHVFWSDGMVRVSGREYNGLIDSPCHQRGDMSCLSCHSMHAQGWPADARPEWAADQLKPGMHGNAACLQCHADMGNDIAAHTHHAPESSGSECMNCHMPHTTYGLLKAIRSHQISSPSVATGLSTGRPVACNLCHLDQTLEWSAQHLADWYGQPVPEIPETLTTTSAAVVQMLTGDAGQRALIVWAFGWEPAQQASGVDWMPAYLLVLMNDPYDAVSQIAYASLRTLPGFDGYEFDFTQPLQFRSSGIEAAVEDWAGRAPAVRRGELLYGDDGRLQLDRLKRLHSSRNNRAVDLWE